MPATKSSFLDKVLDRLQRLDKGELEIFVQRLARERSFLETLFNTIEDGVLVIDENGKILYFNQAITRLLGWQRETTEGEPISRFLPELDWGKLAAVDRAGGAKIARFEFEVQYPRARLLNLYAAPLDGDAAGSLGLALIVHDATEAREKTHAAIEIERLQALTLLAGSVAHEIGNPLNALHIHLQLIERELKKLRTPSTTVAPLGKLRFPRKAQKPAELSPSIVDGLDKVDRYLKVASGEITRLDTIVTQFLQAIRPSPPQKRAADLNEVVRATIELLRPEIENRGITIRQELARTLPLGSLDPGQVKQALVNLMRNALQAMTKGGVLRVATDSMASEVRVTVSDTGGGIPPEVLNRIFEPFYTTKKKGTGLGLMIVQRIVREHGGHIELESDVGKGTTFRLSFPCHERQLKMIAARHD